MAYLTESEIFEKHELYSMQLEQGEDYKEVRSGGDDYTPFITAKPSGIQDGVVLRTPFLVDEMETFSTKTEQIIRVNQFRLKHFEKFQTLTKREVEVLKLLAKGWRNNRVSDELFLSKQTVETHRKNIRRKLELGTFLDLMRYAFAFNLVEY